MCCVLVLTIYELGGATATVVYMFNPIESILKETDLHINFFLMSSKTPEIDNKLTFTVIPVNPALRILSSSYKVSVKKVDSGYSGEFDVPVATLPGPDGVQILTGDLNATLSCDHLILCTDDDEDKIVVKTKVIVQETKSKCHCVYTSNVVPTTSSSTQLFM